MAIKVGDVILEEEGEIRTKLIDYYAHLFKEEEWRPFLNSSSFKTISEREANELIKPFSEEEIRTAAFSMEATKSPGLDGFSVSFYQKFWEVVNRDVVAAVNEFGNNPWAVKHFNATFLFLIPKKEIPKGIAHYTSISLLNCSYMIIITVLAKHLKDVIDKVVDSNQSAFIRGRYILDNYVAAYESKHDQKQRKQEAVIFKIDFEKAYGRINWRCLYRAMHLMGFKDKWLGWIRNCVESARIYILNNGERSQVRES